jgi:hypothetical protein
LPLLGDGPAVEAARMMGLGAKEFEKLLPQYLARKFPAPDDVSGLFDLDAIVHWRMKRHAELYDLTGSDEARDAKYLVEDRIKGLFGGRQ